eukprot:496969-Prorocentrum_minimum.AAC.1
MAAECGAAGGATGEAGGVRQGAALHAGGHVDPAPLRHRLHRPRPAAPPADRCRGVLHLQDGLQLPLLRPRGPKQTPSNPKTLKP